MSLGLLPKQIPKEYVTLDFETYYDKDYTLKKMSTTEYVRDKRFQILTCSIRTSRQKKAKCYVGYKAVKVVLMKLKMGTKGLVCHNTAFDGLILKEHFDIVPAFYYDTLSMARPLHGSYIKKDLDTVAKHYGLGGKVKKGALDSIKGKRLEDLTPGELKYLKEYNNDDTDDTAVIFEQVLQIFPRDELDIIHITINAYANPVLRVNRKLAKEVLEEDLAHQEKIMDIARKKLKIKKTPTWKDEVSKTLGSNPKFAVLLESLNVEVPLKISPKTGEEAFAFSKDDLGFQELQRHKSHIVRAVMEARVAVKSTISSSRSQALLNRTINNAPLPIMLNYCAAHTMRWTGGDGINPQNFPRGSKLRKALKAPSGYSIVVVDSSQIEDRTNCWLAGQDDILDAYRRKEDVYSLQASEIYGFPVDKKKNPDERFVGKVARLGLGYQMGGATFQLSLEKGSMGPPVKMSIDDAKKAVAAYRRTNPAIKGLWKELDQMLDSMIDGHEDIDGLLKFYPDRVLMPNGLSLHYNDLQHKGFEKKYDTGRGYTKIYGGKFTENVIQCLARIIVGLQMVKIARKYRVITMTHDEVVFMCKTSEAKKAYAWAIDIMREPPDWAPELPLDAEGGYAVNYSK